MVRILFMKRMCHHKRKQRLQGNRYDKQVAQDGSIQGTLQGINPCQG